MALLLSFPAAMAARPARADSRWTESAANAWYAKQPWLVGSNFIPATAINELEMWQADTFDPREIDTELGWAESLRLNTMRVFLHDLLWQQDPEGFKERVAIFLEIASRHHIKALFELFDSCRDANPKLGKQREPRSGVHNSGWVQSPGATALQDPSQYPRLKNYVQGIVGAFGQDQRVLGSDLWNEPDNTNEGSYSELEPHDKNNLVLTLLPQVFAWARAAHPSQPLYLFHVVGRPLPDKVEVIAGVYADGGTFGQPVRVNNILKVRAKRASEYEDATAILQQGLDQNWTSNQYLQAFSDKPDSGPVYTVRTALAVNEKTAHTPQAFTHTMQFSLQSFRQQSEQLRKVKPR